MLVRDDYIKMLEKRASDFDGGKIGPTFDHDVNSAEQGTAEHKKNLNENREYLGGLFKNMGEARRVETASANKWSPTKLPEETSSPLIKIAMDTLSNSIAFREYPLHYKAAAVRGFMDELQKVAFVGVDDLVGGVVGYNYGKRQAQSGEPYHFGAPQVGSLLLPGGAGYQLGRGIAHANHKKPPQQ